jgi:polysaccharide export outer membrane protein
MKVGEDGLDAHRSRRLRQTGEAKSKGRGWKMKKLMSFGIILIGILLIYHSVAYPQTEKAEKEALLKKQAQAEVAADSENYIIGAEDILYIHIWKEENLSRTVPVRRDGIISLPLVDEIKAEGLTPLQLKEILAQRFKEFIGDPNITVMVMEANSFKIYVSGQIRNPGVYRLRSETSILQIIPMVGGFTDWANQKKILIIRKEDGKEKRITINYKKIVSGEAPGSNIILKPGDAIIVP